MPLSQRQRRSFAYPVCDQIDDGSERADPAAEEAAEDYGEDKHQNARQQDPGETPGGKKESHENERVRPEKTVDGYGDFILTAIIGNDKENKERGEKKKLGDAGSGKFRHHAFTIFTLLRSISPRPRLCAVTVIGISAGLRPKRPVA